MFKKPNRISLITILAIAIAFSVIRLANPPNNIISYDYYGSYLYLPNVFIYQDIGMENFHVVDSLNNVYRNTPLFYQFSAGKDGQKVLRYFTGLSYLFSPGFTIGHLIALHSDYYPADGFSKPYQRALLVNGLIFSLLGLFFARKILLHFFSDMVTTITILLIFIGTNLTYFYTYGNDAPHVYLFSLYTIFLWVTIQWHKQPRIKTAALLGFISGLIIMSRPSEMMALIIPVFWGTANMKSIRKRGLLFVRHYKHILIALLIVILLIIPQIIYWKIVSGSYIFFPYDDPASSLHLTSPKFIHTLFGFRKGWFIYSPMMIFSMVGLLIMFRRKPGYAWPIIVFTVLNIYLIASFSSLISYGWRAFIQSYALLIIPMGFFVDYVFSRKRIIRTLIFSLLILLSLLQTFKNWQLKIGVIDGSRMTREYFFATFFKLKATVEDKKLLLIQRLLPKDEILRNEDAYNYQLLELIDFETPVNKQAANYDSIFVYSGNYSFRLDSNMQYSPGFSSSFRDLTRHYYAWIRASAIVMVPEKEQMDKLRLVVHFTNKGRVYKYRAWPLSSERYEAKPGEWTKIWIDYMTPEVVSSSDKLKVYLWYQGAEPVYVDNLKIELFHKDQ